MTTRRGFLRMLGFAPLAAAVPVAAVRASIDNFPEPLRSISLGFPGGVTWADGKHIESTWYAPWKDAWHDDLPEPLRSVRTELELTDREVECVARAYVKAYREHFKAYTRTGIKYG